MPTLHTLTNDSISCPLPDRVENVNFHYELENQFHPTYGLENLGMKNLGRVYRNLSVPQLVEQAIKGHEGVLADNGALVVETGKYTGRSPKDKFIVKETSSEGEIDWNQHNAPISEEKFQQLYRKVLAYVQGKDLYIFDGLGTHQQGP